MNDPKGYWSSSFLCERFIGFLKRKEIAITYILHVFSVLFAKKPLLLLRAFRFHIFYLTNFLYRFDLTKNLLKLYLIECILSLTFPAYYLEQATMFRRLLKLSGYIDLLYWLLWVKFNTYRIVASSNKRMNLLSKSHST